MDNKEIEIGTVLLCHRVFDCDYILDYSLNSFVKKGTYRLTPGNIYIIKGCGSLFMTHGVINPFTGEDYEAHEQEVGFSIEVTFEEYTTLQFYFSTDPKSPIFYGKWFFNDAHYREYKMGVLLDEN